MRLLFVFDKGNSMGLILEARSSTTLGLAGWIMFTPHTRSNGSDSFTTRLGDDKEIESSTELVGSEAFFTACLVVHIH